MDFLGKLSNFAKIFNVIPHFGHSDHSLQESARWPPLTSQLTSQEVDFLNANFSILDLCTQSMEIWRFSHILSSWKLFDGWAIGKFVHQLAKFKQLIKLGKLSEWKGSLNDKIEKFWVYSHYYFTVFKNESA